LLIPFLGWYQWERTSIYLWVEYSTFWALIGLRFSLLICLFGWYQRERTSVYLWVEYSTFWALRRFFLAFNFVSRIYRRLPTTSTWNKYKTLWTLGS
jgi:hypothetical protein